MTGSWTNDATEPPTKRARVPLEQSISTQLGELVQRDAKLVEHFGFPALIESRRSRGDFTNLQKVRHHPAHHLLRQYSRRGAPVVYSTKPRTTRRIERAVHRGPHKSSYEHIDFLQEEMVDFIRKSFWLLLPYSIAKKIKGLRIAPFGVIPQHNRRPRVICDFSFHGQNDDTVPLAPLEAMQFGRALERYLRHIVLADPRFGPVKMIKVDISDGFYRVWVRAEDVAKLGMVFPTRDGKAPLIAFPLSLPMGWKNSPPFFSAVTETIADIANQRLLKNRPVPAHRLEKEAESSPEGATSRPTLQAAKTQSATAIPKIRDPALCNRPARRLALLDVYVDDFLGLAQGNRRRLRYVRRILLNTIDDVLRPNDEHDNKYRKEPISVKKLRQGDASWDTVKEILGWIIDTNLMTLNLAPRRLQRLAELLNQIGPQQRRISVKSWHKLLGELRSMSIALPGSRGLFSLLQEAFRSEDPKHRIKITEAVQAILGDFRWLHQQLADRPTRLYEVVPLPPNLVGAHDAAGHGAGGVLFPTASSVPRRIKLYGQPHTKPSLPHPRTSPVVWRVPFPKQVKRELVTFKNPNGSITNSDLELAGNLYHQEAAAQCYDIRERTILSKTDNLPTMFWARKGSTTTTAAPAYLLRLLSYHQRYHRYLPRHDYLPGVLNKMADDASRLQHLSNKQFLSYFNSTYPQKLSWRLWTPTPQMNCAVTSALFRKPSEPASFLLEPQPPMPLGNDGRPSALRWPSIPYSATSKNQSCYSKSSATGTEQADSLPVVDKSGLERLRMSYGTLGKRSLVWGPTTHA